MHSVLILHASGALERRKRQGAYQANNMEIQQVERSKVSSVVSITGVSGSTHTLQVRVGQTALMPEETIERGLVRDIR